MDPFTNIPLADAPPMPPKKDSGIEITRAQGQLITKKVSPLVIQSPQPADCPKINSLNKGGSTANASAA